MSWRFRDRPRSTPAAPHEEVAQELELPGNDAKFLVGAGLMQPVDHRDLRMRRSGLGWEKSGSRLTRKLLQDFPVMRWGKCPLQILQWTNWFTGEAARVHIARWRCGRQLAACSGTQQAEQMRPALHNARDIHRGG